MSPQLGFHVIPALSHERDYLALAKEMRARRRNCNAERRDGTATYIAQARTDGADSRLCLLVVKRKATGPHFIELTEKAGELSIGQIFSCQLGRAAAIETLNARTIDFSEQGLPARSVARIENYTGAIADPQHVGSLCTRQEPHLAANTKHEANGLVKSIGEQFNMRMEQVSKHPRPWRL